MFTDLPEPQLRAYRSTLEEPADFAEFWEGTLAEARRHPLDLTVRGDSIVGRHCAVTKNATRVDCSAEETTGDASEDSSPSIRGTFDGADARVHFESYYGVDSAMNPIGGTATMTLDGDRLAWKIVDFTPGDFYLPMQATLKRERKR